MRLGRSVVHNLHAHLVFATKYRRGMFDTEMLNLCEQPMAQVCADFGATLAEFNQKEDHAHLLAAYPPKVALSHGANSLKGVSSRQLRQDFAGRPTRLRSTARSGHHHTSPDPPAPRHCPQSRTTSPTRNNQTRQGLLPEGQGFHPK